MGRIDEDYPEAKKAYERLKEICIVDLRTDMDVETGSDNYGVTNEGLDDYLDGLDLQTFGDMLLFLNEEKGRNLSAIMERGYAETLLIDVLRESRIAQIKATQLLDEKGISHDGVTDEGIVEYAKRIRDMYEYGYTSIGPYEAYMEGGPISDERWLETLNSGNYNLVYLRLGGNEQDNQYYDIVYLISKESDENGIYKMLPGKPLPIVENYLAQGKIKTTIDREATIYVSPDHYGCGKDRISYLITEGKGCRFPCDIQQGLPPHIRLGEGVSLSQIEEAVSIHEGDKTPHAGDKTPHEGDKPSSNGPGAPDDPGDSGDR